MSLHRLRSLRGPASVFIFVLTLLIADAFEFNRIAEAQKLFAGTITGRVFRDYNGNGAYDTTGGTAAQPTSVDAGLAGVTVSAYDANGVFRGSATSIADGTYSLSATGTGPYRLEFTTLPTGYRPSARSTDSTLGGTASNAGSTVQFVDDGNTSNVNLAVNRPGDYCEDNPTICSQLYGYGGATQVDA
ncbi:MAG TPA: hypothetical protein DDW24_08650, partial [Blastocatellia bacterium]|nr:hypothetical protein [Blastocatellia bacterium]